MTHTPLPLLQPHKLSLGHPQYSVVQLLKSEGDGSCYFEEVNPWKFQWTLQSKQIRVRMKEYPLPQLKELWSVSLILFHNLVWFHNLGFIIFTLKYWIHKKGSQHNFNGSGIEDGEVFEVPVILGTLLNTLVRIMSNSFLVLPPWTFYSAGLQFMWSLGYCVRHLFIPCKSPFLKIQGETPGLSSSCYPQWKLRDGSTDWKRPY